MARSKRLIEKTLSLKIEPDRSEVGTLQHKVMSEVADKKYEDAVISLKAYREKKKYYPGYVVKTDRLFTHAEDLVNAIKSKKNFPNMSGLTQSKQEELAQKVREHWEELRISLRRLKTIEKDIEMEDARSTLWVVRAVIFSIILILIIFVAKEAILSMGVPVKVFVDDLVTRILNSI
jgi:hypothetical protein